MKKYTLTLCAILVCVSALWADTPTTKSKTITTPVHGPAYDWVLGISREMKPIYQYLNLKYPEAPSAASVARVSFNDAIAGYTMLSEAGNKIATIALAFVYAQEDPTPMFERTLARLKKDAEQGFAPSQATLAACMLVYEDQYKDEDFAQLFALLKDPMQANFPPAFFYAGYIAVSRNESHDIVTQYLEQGAALGDANCLFLLGHFAYQNDDYETEITCYKKLAECDDLLIAGKAIDKLKDLYDPESEEASNKAEYIKYSRMYYEKNARYVQLQRERIIAAIPYYREQALQGDVWCATKLLEAYDPDRFYAPSEENYIWALTRAADSGNKKACNQLAHYYLIGDTVPKDINKAEYYYTKAGDKGDITDLSIIYAATLLKDVPWFYGYAHESEDYPYRTDVMTSIFTCNLDTSKIDKQKAFEFLKRNAGGDIFDLDPIIAICYAYGIGCEKNTLKADSYGWSRFLRDEYDGTLEDFIAEGTKLYKGLIASTQDTNTSLQKNLAEKKRNADEGNARDCYQYATALLHELTYLTSEMNKEAFTYLQKAADGQYAEAFGTLGDCYLHGRGTESDYEKALYYHRLAAACGNDDSQMQMVRFYLLGLPPLSFDFDKAGRWCLLAAFQDNYEAYRMLKKFGYAEIYEKLQNAQDSYDPEIDYDDLYDLDDSDEDATYHDTREYNQLKQLEAYEQELQQKQWPVEEK